MTPHVLPVRRAGEQQLGCYRERRGWSDGGGAVLGGRDLQRLGIDPFAYPRKVLPRLFAPGEKSTAEQLLNCLPDRWLLRQSRDAPERAANVG
jgi:hypothetical protein